MWTRTLAAVACLALAAPAALGEPDDASISADAIQAQRPIAYEQAMQLNDAQLLEHLKLPENQVRSLVRSPIQPVVTEDGHSSHGRDHFEITIPSSAPGYWAARKRVRASPLAFIALLEEREPDAVLTGLSLLRDGTRQDLRAWHQRKLDAASGRDSAADDISRLAAAAVREHALQHDDARVRDAGYELLADLNVLQIEDLRLALADGSDAVRSRIVFRFTPMVRHVPQHELRALVPMLLAHGNDPDWMVRQYVHLWLRDLFAPKRWEKHSASVRQAVGKAPQRIDSLRTGWQDREANIASWRAWWEEHEATLAPTAAE